MKFFSQFLSCYHPTVVVEDPPPRDEPVTRPTTTTTQQVPFSKRKKLTGSKSASAVNWRPALSVISEDVVVVPFLESTKSEKKSSSTKTISVHKKSRSYSYADEYSSRKIRMPIIISTFSPTPVMF